MTRASASAGAACGLALLLAVPAWSQDPMASFAPPVRLKAGDKLMGEARLFPSPVFEDMDGDGRADLVIGDLIGRMTVALRLPGGGPPRFGPESVLKGADGKDLKFHNW